MLLANHGALTVGARSLRRVLQDGDDRALREDQPRGAAARRENLIAREEVTRLQELRGTYGIKAPAPICATGDADPARAQDPAHCQVVQAPGRRRARLVPDRAGDSREHGGSRRFDGCRTRKFG